MLHLTAVHAFFQVQFVITEQNNTVATIPGNH